MYRNTVPLQGMFNSSRMMCRLFMTAVILYATVCSCEQEGHHELCYPNRFSHDSVVCVCNVTHCADIGRIHPEDGHILMYQSTLEGQRFKKSVLHFGSNGTANLTLKLGDRTLHKIFGFGSSFTDSAGVNWMSLPEGLRDRLIGAYYSVEGSEYSMGRIPMAGCEFSTRDYTYADTKDDFEMNNFSLALEDINYKLPMVKKANDFAKEEVLYIGSPFSPPGWMKDTGTTAGPSRMKGDPGGPYYKAWALYFVKFFQEYKMNGVDIWGFTIQNEPTSGHYPLWKWQTMRLTPDVERDFIKNDLGPVLFNATEGKIKLMILDDNTYVLPWWAMVVYRDEDAAKYVAGLAVHWYYNQQTNPEALNFTYHLDPTKFILGTEACEGFQDHRVHLGSWSRAESYAVDVLTDLRHSVSGWLDRNMFLDMQGGPSWVEHFVDAPIIVDKESQAFYKQPMYYALAHFSKFLPRGSARIHDTVTSSKDKLHVVAFLRPDGTKTAITINREEEEVFIKVKDKGRIFWTGIRPRSIASLLWR